MESILDDMIPWLGALVFLALLLFPKSVYRSDGEPADEAPKDPSPSGEDPRHRSRH